jgi:hypothetical protein
MAPRITLVRLPDRLPHKLSRMRSPSPREDRAVPSILGPVKALGTSEDRRTM